MPLTFEQFSESNRNLSQQVFGGNNKELLYWSNATAGEAGELANVVKKIYRDTPDQPLTQFYIRKLMEEAAETVMYADLLLNKVGITLEEAITYEFNRVSAKKGHPSRIGVSTPKATAKPLKPVKHVSWMQRIDDFLAEPLTPEQWQEFPIDRFILIGDGTPLNESIRERIGETPLWFELPCGMFVDWGNEKLWGKNLDFLKKWLDGAALLNVSGITINCENEQYLTINELGEASLDPTKVWPEGDQEQIADRMRQFVETVRESLPDATIGADVWLALEESLPGFPAALNSLLAAAGERRIVLTMDGVSYAAKELGVPIKQTAAYFQLRSPRAYSYKLMERYLRKKAPRIYIFNNMVYFAAYPQAFTNVRDTLVKAKMP